MSDSFIEAKAEMMRLLLWNNIAKRFVESYLPTLPGVGFIFALPVVKDLIWYLFETYVLDPLFLEMTRFGVFVSIEWENEAQQRAYEAEAIKLVPLQDKEIWDEEDKKKFDDAALNLIAFHLKPTS